MAFKEAIEAINWIAGLLEGAATLHLDFEKEQEMSPLDNA